MDALEETVMNQNSIIRECQNEQENLIQTLQASLLKNEGSKIQKEMNSLKEHVQEEISALKADNKKTEENEKIKMETTTKLHQQVEGLTQQAKTWANVVQGSHEKMTNLENVLNKNAEWIEVAKNHRPTNPMPSAPSIINDTLEEEKRRKNRALNVRVVGWKEDKTPQEDAIALCTKMGTGDKTPTEAWRVGKDATREQPLSF